MNDIKLKQFYDVNWECATRTFGNDHATLVRLIVDWWNSQHPKHWVLEAGPAIVKGKRRKQCDAILCNEMGPTAVLEIEGSRLEYTLKSIAKCLTSPLDNFESISTGILVTYGYEPKGTGIKRTVPPIPIETLLQYSRDFTRNLIGKKLIIITVDKKYEPDVHGIRRLNPYYRCTVSRIEGIELLDGKVTGRELFYAGHKQ